VRNSTSATGQCGDRVRLLLAPARGQHHVLVRHVDQAAQFADVAERAGLLQLVHHRDEERLLAMGAVQVAVLQAVALTRTKANACDALRVCIPAGKSAPE
jgi:hypothetical protein